MQDGGQLQCYLEYLKLLHNLLKVYTSGLTLKYSKLDKRGATHSACFMKLHIFALLSNFSMNAGQQLHFSEFLGVDYRLRLDYYISRFILNTFFSIHSGIEFYNVLIA